MTVSSNIIKKKKNISFGISCHKTLILEFIYKKKTKFISTCS